MKECTVSVIDVVHMHSVIIVRMIVMKFSLCFIARVTIITAPEDLAVAVGQDVTFICVANGHRPPTIEWFQTNNNSVMFRDSESETLMNGTVISTLFISDVMDNDFGNYSCVASNEFSSERANFTLSLAGE